MPIFNDYLHQRSNYGGLRPEIYTKTAHFSTPAAALTAQFVLPVRSELVWAEMSVSSSGTVGGTTTVTIVNTTQASADLAGGFLSIAAAAATLYDYVNVTRFNFATWADSATHLLTPLTGIEGDVYTVTVSAIPTGLSSTDLTVTLHFLTL